MNLQQLKYIIAVAEAKSITKAAQICLSQPIVTHNATLETLLGAEISFATP